MTFLSKFHADLSHYKEMRVHCTRYKKLPPFSPLFCTPLAQGAKNFNTQDLSLPTYACKILSGSVKICWSYLRKANFEQMHIGSIELRTSLQAELSFFLQSAKLQLANLLQNCYFCFIQKTISNSLLWSLVINIFLVRLFCAPLPAAPGDNCPLSYATALFCF